ncbi:MAG: recombination protein NinB [Oxalobacter sp.]|nr:recombination protein NinB [Oxalobacter sp.]
MRREKYPPRRFLIRSAVQKDYACAAIGKLPEDQDRPIEVVIREQVQARKLDQNALMWAGPLEDICRQVYLDGRMYSKEVWHEYFKREFLPEMPEEGMTLDGYRKWAFLPNGDRVLKGSTTDLTKKGFARYLEQVYAFGAQYGVQFGVRDEA